MNLFTPGLEIVKDQDAANEILAASSRPDLVMRNRVAMMPIQSPNNLRSLDNRRGINNFIANLMGFGICVYDGEEESVSGDREMEPRCIGRRQLTSQEREMYFSMGTRGGLDEHLAFAKAQGIDAELAQDAYMETHIQRESFMRMWVLVPELTQSLMATCLEEPGPHKKIDEEVYVAYSLMSRLVDESDRGAVINDGSIDDWLLCH